MKKDLLYIVVIFFVIYAIVIGFSHITTRTLTSILMHKDNLISIKDDLKNVQISLLTQQAFANTPNQQQAYKFENDIRSHCKDIEQRLRTYVNNPVSESLKKLDKSIAFDSHLILDTWKKLKTEQILNAGKLSEQQNQTINELSSQLNTLILTVDNITLNQIRVFQTFYFFLLGMFVFALFYTIGMRKEIVRRRQAEKLANSLSQKLLRLQDEERNKIAFELHDNIAQELSAALIHHQNGDADQTYNKVKASLKQIRTLSYQLYTQDIQSIGLRDSIEKIVSEVSFESDIQFSLSIVGIKEHLLPQEILQNVYQIVREALLNIKKHSQARQGNIKITYSSPYIYVRINDNGKGFDTEKVMAASAYSGIGLHSMQRRIEYLGGNFDIKSSTGGTSISIRISVKRNTIND